MKDKLKFLPLIFMLWSCDAQQDNGIKHESFDKQSIEYSPSSKMTFFDNDSIYNQTFQTASVYDGEKLNWEVKFYENGLFKTTLKDSINSMSYLVDAVDLNSDAVGELVIVTGKPYPAFDDVETIRCQIFCYVRIGQDWIKKSVPELTAKQLQAYFGNEVVSIEKNKIIRTYSIYNDKKEDTGKKKMLIYGLDKDLELVIIEET
jgi:hypothetical protein